MLRILITAIFLMFTYLAAAQEYVVGHRTATFNDPLRSGGFGTGGGPGRQIQSEIYYPAITVGENAPTGKGVFPLIIFGHGYLMAWEAYRNIWEKLVPQGFILVFPRTESGMNPDHAGLAQDMSICINRMQDAGQDPANFFYGVIAPSTALMGHSMGGGCAFLAAAGNPAVATVVGLAPLETDPKASQSAADIIQPALILSGSSDGVTPPRGHHQPIFDNLASACKYLISILGGAHCYFANQNLACDVGEMLVSGNITISRTQQQTIMNEYLTLWLQYTLQKKSDSGRDFTELLATDNRVEGIGSCLLSVDNQPALPDSRFIIAPNPASETLTIRRFTSGGPVKYRLCTLTGQVVIVGSMEGWETIISLESIPAGQYEIVLTHARAIAHFKVVVVK